MLKDFQRSKNPKHISRKEVTDNDALVNKKLKNDRILAHGPIDFTSRKPKTKSCATSTAKKDERQKYVGVPPAKLKRDKSLTSSSESLYLSDKGTKLHERILIREGYKAMMSEINERKYKDDGQILNALKQEEQKYKSHSKQPGRSKSDASSYDQSKRSDKQKSKINTSSEISEDFDTASNSVASVAKHQTSSNDSSQYSKSKETDKSQKSKNSEEPKYGESAASHASVLNSVLGSSTIETKMSEEGSNSERLMDPRRISFRDDSYSQQSEFCQLVTPDMNLKLRSKRRKQAMQGSDGESVVKEEENGTAESVSF